MTDAKTSHLYFNIAISNPATATAAIPCTLQTTLTQGPLLDVANRYKAALARYSLPLSSLAYFQCPANKFIFTLSYNGVDYSVPVSLINWDSANNSDTGVYYVQQFIDSCNLALSVADQKVAQANPSIPALATAPMLSFNPTTQLITLLTPFNTWESGAPNSPAIWMNTSLAALFASMPQTLVATNSISGKDVQFRIISRPAWTATTTGTAIATLGNGLAIGHLTTALTQGQTVSQLFTSATTLPLAPGQNMFLYDSTGNNEQFDVFCPQRLAGTVGSLRIPVVSFTAAYAFPITTTSVFVVDYAQLQFTVPAFIPSGTTLAITSGTNRQLVTTSAIASAGDAAVSVNSFVPNFAYPLGSTITPVASNGMISTTDESASVLSWWSTTSIVVTSSSLPVRQEMLPTSSAGVYNTAPILSDFCDPPRKTGCKHVPFVPTGVLSLLRFDRRCPCHASGLAVLRDHGLWAAQRLDFDPNRPWTSSQRETRVRSQSRRRQALPSRRGGGKGNGRQTPVQESTI